MQNVLVILSLRIDLKVDYRAYLETICVIFVAITTNGTYNNFIFMDISIIHKS